MEECRNKVIKLHATYSRILVNLVVKLTRMNPKVKGGAMGGPYPCPKEGVAMGSDPIEATTPHGPKWVGWPQGPWHPPCLGGEIHSREGSQGWMFTWVFPYVILPDGPPNLGSIAGHSLPIFTDFSDFLGRLSR